MNPTRPTVPPRKRSLVQEVVDDLAAKIRHGVYQPGEKFPTEPVVMAGHGVSRTVVREAMSRLQAAGFVETRHGVGTFVLPPPVAPGAPAGLATAVTIRDVLAMLELRISLETEAASLAALRRTDAHLAKMRRAIADFEAGLGRGETSVEADFQFHLQIALATGNRYFEDFYRHLGTRTIPRTRVDVSALSPEPAESYLHRTNREHEGILEAIARGDPEAARAAMRMHLTNSCERLRRAGEAMARRRKGGPARGGAR